MPKHYTKTYNLLYDNLTTYGLKKKFKNKI
jgi:hypothetical protein